MELDKTLAWMKLYVDYANLWGTIHIRFDTETKTLVASESKAHSIRYTITIVIMFLARCIMAVFLIRDILNHNFGLEDKFDILQMAIMLVYFYCIGNHLHHFWKSPEIVSTVSSFLIFYKDYQRRAKILENPGPRKQHFIFNLCLQATFFGLLSTPLGCSVYYFESCRGHFFSSVLPICQKVDGKWGHVEWPSLCYIFGLCFLQFFLVTDCNCAMYLNTGGIYLLIFGSQQISQDLKTSNKGPEGWLRDYRSLKVLEAQINACIGGFWLPFNLFGLMLINVACTSLVLRVYPGFTMSGICGIVACISFVTQFILTYYSSNSAASSEEAIKLQLKKCKDGLEIKALRACKPFGIQSGSFRILDRKAMLIVMMANVDYTVSALLAL